MRRVNPQLVCSSCLTSIRQRTLAPRIAQPWISQRFVSLRKPPSKPRPSRMVLSNQVYRPPVAGRQSRSRREVEGPFGGMNRTVANIDPARRAARTRTASRSDGNGSTATNNSKTNTDTNTNSRYSGYNRRDKEARSADDRKALKMQRSLASVSYTKRMSVKDRMAEYEAFEQFDLLPSIQEALHGDLFRGLTDVKPTPVQRLALPAIMGQAAPGTPQKPGSAMESFLLAAETGSGKTLAYLLPAVDALKRAEARDPDIRAYNERLAAEKRYRETVSAKARPFDEPHPTMARPKVVVLVPTAELAQQVMGVAKKLSHAVKFKVEMLSSDLKPQQIQRNMYGPRGLDVVVSTPHLLASIADSDPNILSRVTHLVVDEADSLLDRSFSPVTTSIIERATPSLQRLVCCSATIPRKLNNYLATNYPDMHRITTPNLHAIPRRVQLGVIDVSRDPYRNNKDLACAEAIYALGKDAAGHEGPVKDEIDVRRVLVFVNEREKTEQVAEYLRARGIHATALHRDTPESRPGEILEVFTTPEPLTVKAPQKPAGGRARRLDNVRVLVVTDLASRGIDTLAVRHVILYDVPHTTIDFIHRLGRAGRMGRRGRGIVLAGNDDRKDVVAEVKRSMFEGKALI